MLTLWSKLVCFIFLEDFEFFCNLVSLPVAITSPIIELCYTLQPAHIVFFNVIGSGFLF